METIIALLGIACAITLLINTDFWQRAAFTKKPWSCAMCTAFWLSLLPIIVVWGPVAPLYASIVAITTEFLDRKLNHHPL